MPLFSDVRFEQMIRNLCSCTVEC